MKSVTVTELKTHLSRYLRLAARGERIVVKDRDDPVAELGPLQKQSIPWWERMAREGRLIRGTQDWGSLRISPMKRPIDVQAILQDVREDPSETHLPKILREDARGRGER